jgi:hypothetical protein
MSTNDPHAANKPPVENTTQKDGTLIPMLIAGLVMVTVGYAIIMMFV